MADMYNKDYADDILRKLKQKIISENPEAVEALDAFAEATPPETDEVEETAEEMSLFDVENGEEDEFSEQDQTDFSDDEEGEEPSCAPIDYYEDETDKGDETEEDAFGYAEEVSEEDEEEDAFGYAEEDEDEDEEEEYWEAEKDEADDSDEDNGIPPWETLEEDESEDDTAFQEDVLEYDQEIPENDESEEPDSIVDEEIPPEKSEKEEDIPEIEEIPSEIDIHGEETVEDILPFLSKRRRQITEDPEESVLVQKSEEQTDVLKHPLPRGQKLTSSFFLRRKQKEGEEEHPGNSSITAWRTVLAHTRWTFVALILMALITAFLVVLECIPALRTAIFAKLDTALVPKAAMLLDSFGLLLCLLLYLPAIIQGIKRLSDRVLDVELSTAAITFVAMVYQTVVAFLDKGLFLVGMPFAFLLTLSQLSRLFMALAVQNSAEICLNSHNGTTAVLRRASDLPEVKEALADSEYDHHLVMSTARFTDPNAFLARLEKEHISSRYNLIGLCGALLMGVISGVFAAVYKSPHAVGYGIAVLCAAYPLTAYLVHHWSFFRLAKELRQANMTVAGEYAVYELANADVVCLRDVDAFPAKDVKITHIKLCEDKRLDLIFIRLRALFAVLGGPLSGIFSVSGESVDRQLDVTVTDITHDGISAIVDGEVVHVGKGAYMAQKGIGFMYDADDEAILRTTDTPIMFVSCGGVSSAKIYLRYQISEAFESYVHHLTGAGIGVILRTRDPFITGKMIDRLSCLEKGTVGVVRSTLGGKTVTDALSGGLVGYGTKPQHLYRTRFLFSAYRRMQKSLPWLSLASIPLCGVLCALSAAAGAVSLSLMAVLYQLLGVIPSLLIVEAVLRKYHMGDKR